MSNCLYPIPALVLPTGSLVRKDGSLGRKVIIGPKAQLPIESYISYETGEVPQYFDLPCGKCINCRKSQANQWRIRIMMEAQDYDPDDMCFLTLTYDQEHLPYTKSGKPTIKYEDFQNFINYLKIYIKRKTGVQPKIRYFVAGEYGGIGNRPHFHVILFGYNFFENAYYSTSGQSGEMLFSNEFIDKAWHRGIANFGRVSAKSAQYVAQYTVKKLVQDYKKDDRCEPLIQMSRRPGIGNKFILEHKEEIYQSKGAFLLGEFVPINEYMYKVLSKDGVITEVDKYKLNELKAEIARIRIENFERETGRDYQMHNRELASIYIQQQKQKLRSKLRC